MILPANLVILAVAAIGAFVLGLDVGGERIQRKWDEERSLANVRHIRDLEQAHENQLRLQSNVNQLTEKYHAETHRLNLLAADLRDQLRNRPARPTHTGDLSNHTRPESIAQGCTGAELYRPDAEFLVGEATRADQLRESLKECRAAYDALGQSENSSLEL
jgi:hypothetical protein